MKKRADRTDPQGSNAEEFKESLLVKENTEDADESNPTGYIPECVPPPKFPSIVISNPESSNNFSTLQENINTVLHSPVETMLNRKEFLLNLTKTVGAKLYKPAKKAKGKPTRQELDHMISTAKKLRGANDKETSVNNEFNPEEYLNNRNKKFKSLKGTYKKTNKPKRLKDLLRIKFNSPLDYFLQRTAPTRVKTNLIPDSKNKIENFVVSNNLDNMGDFGNFLSSKRGHQIIAESNLSSTYLHRRNNTQKKETKKEINKLMGYIKSSQSNSKGAPSDRKDHDDNRLKLKLMNVSAMTTAPSRGSLTSGFQPIPFTDKTLTPKEAASSFCSNKVPAEVNTDSQTLNLRKSGESARSLSTVEVQAKKRLSYSQKLSNKKLGVVAPSEYNAFSQYVPKQELIDKTLKKNHNEALESIFKKNNSAIKKITNTKSSKEKKENKNSQKVVDKSTINEEYLIEYNELARYINDCKYYNLDYNKHNEYPATTLSFYKYGRPLGRGAFGKVNIGLHIASGRLVAIKTFNKDNLTLESTQRKLFLETTLMKTLQHKNIVRIYETFETDKYHMIILEYVCGGDLMSYVRKRNYLSENVARFLFRQLIEALKYMHAQGIVHRDIKLDNILLDVDRNIKICDFGVSKLNPKNSIMYEQCGTPAYIAPEILLDEGYSGFGVDIWSSGVLLYVMLSGMMPFKADTLEDLKGLIVSGQYPSIKDISPEAESLISGLLTVDPTQRLTEDQILSHPWMKIKNYDSKNIQ